MQPELRPTCFADSSQETILLSDLQETRLTTAAADDRSSSTCLEGRYSQLPRTASRMIPGPSQHVIASIEHVFESVADCLLKEGNELSLDLKSRPRDAVTSGNEVEMRNSKRQTTTITFPSKNPQEAWKFGTSDSPATRVHCLGSAAAVFRILELSHEALVTGIVTTKRDMYYKEPKLFMKQAVVDRYVDDIAYTFGITREALNIATSKGLTLGAYTATRSSGSTIDFAADTTGMLIPSHSEISDIQIMDVRWIMVIEKEATFRTLAALGYWKHSSAGKGILITGKGYPDIQTRQFINLLCGQHPFTNIYALMDSDPDGLGILSTYKYGSINLAHESNLAIPSIKWLGLRSSDLLNEYSDAQGLLTLTARDRRLAGTMLQRLSRKMSGFELGWMKELQIMLMLNLKAEIQILGDGGKLAEWLDQKLMFAQNAL